MLLRLIKHPVFLFLVTLVSPAAGVVTFPSGNLTLHGVIYVPSGKGPFPTVLFNHDSAPGMYCNEAFEALGPAFAKEGWVFFAPWRRGQGLSADAGPYIGSQIAASWEKGGPAAADATAVHLLQTDHLQDQLAGLAWLREQRFVDQSRIAVIGDSFGGIETLFGSEKERYCAAADIAGGAKSWTEAPQLQAAMKRAASHSKSPIFFIQAENDYDLTPSKVLSKVARGAGQMAEVKIYPPFGKSAQNGHSFGYRGTTIWRSDALKFMEQNCKSHLRVH